MHHIRREASSSLRLWITFFLCFENGAFWLFVLKIGMTLSLEIPPQPLTHSLAHSSSSSWLGSNATKSCLELLNSQTFRLIVSSIVFWGVSVAQWWEHSPPTIVAGARILASEAMCGLSLLLVLSLAPRGFSPGTLVFLFLKTNTSKFQFNLECTNTFQQVLKVLCG